MVEEEAGTLKMGREEQGEKNRRRIGEEQDRGGRFNIYIYIVTIRPSNKSYESVWGGNGFLSFSLSTRNITT